MIPGVQPKVLVTQRLQGTLTREKDGLSYTGRIGFVEWAKESREFKDLHPLPSIGYSIIVDPHRMDFTWLTTAITKMVHFPRRKQIRVSHRELGLHISVSNRVGLMNKKSYININIKAKQDENSRCLLA